MWDFVSAENSTGFHNPEYALKILAESTDMARQAQMLAAQSVDDMSPVSDRHILSTNACTLTNRRKRSKDAILYGWRLFVSYQVAMNLTKKG